MEQNCISLLYPAFDDGDAWFAPHKPDIVASFPFVPYTSSAPEDAWYPHKWKHTHEASQLSDNSSKKPDEEDISSLAMDEHVNFDAGTMNKNCGGKSNKPPGDDRSIKPPGDHIPFSGSQDKCLAHDGSASACYICGEAGEFARRCSLGCDRGNSIT
ncbi:hypothetical protein AgCh_029646 [Apium graveolens]